MSAFRSGQLLHALLLAAIASPMATADVPAWTTSGDPTDERNNHNGIDGLSFAANAAITVTALGWYDDPATDGLNLAHEVGLYRADTGDLLASTVVPAGTAATKVDGFRFESVTPFELVAGASYVVAGVSTGDSARNLVTGDTLHVAPEITVGDWLFGAGISLQLPTLEIPGEKRFAGASFLFLPEPGTLSLVLLGGVALHKRRRPAR